MGHYQQMFAMTPCDQLVPGRVYPPLAFEQRLGAWGRIVNRILEKVAEGLLVLLPHVLVADPLPLAESDLSQFGFNLDSQAVPGR